MIHWDELLLDKSVDLLVTVIGVGIGSYLALYIAKFQLNQQSQQEKQKNEEITTTLIDRCRLELRDNQSVLTNQLIPVLDLSQRPHELHYEWLLAYAESFQRSAYDDLLKLNLSHNMPKKIEASISTSFEMLDGLLSMIKIALAGFRYQDIYGGTPDFRQISYDNVKTYSRTVLNHLEYSLKVINKF
jgi:hypothetical protein